MKKHSKYYYDFDRNMAHRLEEETDLMYFTTQEFDSPDLLNSGEKMDKGFLKLLDNARHSAGIPFKINSGIIITKHHENWNWKKFHTLRHR